MFQNIASFIPGCQELTAYVQMAAFGHSSTPPTARV